MNYNFAKFGSREHLFGTIAQDLKEGTEQKEKEEKFYLAVSGGKTPVELFRLLNERFSDVNWEMLHIFWVDERMVPGNDPESNYGNAVKYFKMIPEKNIHAISGTGDPVKEAARYEKIIKEIVPSVNGIPQFDLILLGVGTDGHTASIFPRKAFLHENELTAVSEHPSTGQKRITFTLKLINNAREIIFITTGSEKKEIVDRTLRGNNENIPAARVKGNVKWYFAD